MSFKILTLNNIAVEGLRRLPRERYEVASEIGHPDAILVRSANMHTMEIPDSVRAVARAGAGVNNIPIDTMTRRGIPVFNAPGANANAVKELVLAGLLLAARNICQGWDYVRELEGDDAAVSKLVEAGKKKFVGFELPGRTLGVVGLGAIGGRSGQRGGGAGHEGGRLRPAADGAARLAAVFVCRAGDDAWITCSAAPTSSPCTCRSTITRDSWSTRNVWR